jgi:hypothetical protein
LIVESSVTVCKQARLASSKETFMPAKILAVLAAGALGLSASVALAQGHVAGGAVGAAVAPKHHRVAGAVVGGAVGHHMAKTKAKKKAASTPK